MSTLINYKICDNSPECGGIAVCPTKAMSYDEEKNTITIDNEKCINCGLCKANCPVSAIYVAKTEEEYEEYKKEIEEDNRKIKDLFVDRYGAVPISDFFMITEQQLEGKILKDGITLIEVYTDESIQCLLKSIPIKDITEDINGDISFYKLKVTTKVEATYHLKEIPSLLVFKNGSYKGNIDGYFDIQSIQLVKKRIHNLLEKS